MCFKVQGPPVASWVHVAEQVHRDGTFAHRDGCTQGRRGEPCAECWAAAGLVVHCEDGDCGAWCDADRARAHRARVAQLAELARG